MPAHPGVRPEGSGHRFLEWVGKAQQGIAGVYQVQLGLAAESTRLEGRGSEESWRACVRESWGGCGGQAGNGPLQRVGRGGGSAVGCYRLCSACRHSNVHSSRPSSLNACLAAANKRGFHQQAGGCCILHFMLLYPRWQRSICSTCGSWKRRACWRKTMDTRGFPPWTALRCLPATALLHDEYRHL